MTSSVAAVMPQRAPPPVLPRPKLPLAMPPSASGDSIGILQLKAPPPILRRAGQTVLPRPRAFTSVDSNGAQASEASAAHPQPASGQAASAGSRGGVNIGLKSFATTAAVAAAQGLGSAAGSGSGSGSGSARGGGGAAAGPAPARSTTSGVSSAATSPQRASNLTSKTGSPLRPSAAASLYNPPVRRNHHLGRATSPTHGGSHGMAASHDMRTHSGLRPHTAMSEIDARSSPLLSASANQMLEGEDWMLNPQIQDLLQVREESRRHIASLRREAQSRVLWLRQRAKRHPQRMTFEEKMAFFTTAGCKLHPEIGFKDQPEINS